MQVAHELAPAEELANEAFGAGERHGAFSGSGGDVLHEGEGEHAGEVEEGRGLGVEELLLVVTHGVFKGAEEGKELLEGELPEGVGAGLVAGQIEVADGAEVVAVVLGDVGDDFFREGIGREERRAWDGHFAPVGIAVVGVVGELAADGLAALHEDAGFLAHAAVEAIHYVTFSVTELTVDAEEVFGLREPGGVRDLLELEAGGGSGREIEAKLALGRDHHGECGDVAVLLQLKQALAVTAGGQVVEDADAAGGLLEREVAHVADEEDELLLVVRAAQGLGDGFDDDDAGVGGGLLGEWAGAVSEAIVGDVDPATMGEIALCGTVRADAFLEGRHDAQGSVSGSG